MTRLGLALALWAGLAAGAWAQDASAPAKPLYEINFENAAVGKLPEEFMVLNGEFSVKEEAGNKFLELPGAPLDTFGVQFGPARGGDTAVSARVFAISRGRRFPTFGVGLGGVSGYRLVLAPGKQALELWKDEALRASVPFEWKSGDWTLLRLQVRKVQAGEWRVEGKAWSQGSDEPKESLVHCSATEEPVTGRASVVGSPFAGTPIRFDDLAVREAGK